MSALSVRGDGQEEPAILIEAKQLCTEAQSTKTSACVLNLLSKGGNRMASELRAEIRELRAEGGRTPLREADYLHPALVRAFTEALTNG